MVNGRGAEPRWLNGRVHERSGVVQYTQYMVCMWGRLGSVAVPGRCVQKLCCTGCVVNVESEAELLRSAETML